MTDQPSTDPLLISTCPRTDRHGYHMWPERPDADAFCPGHPAPEGAADHAYRNAVTAPLSDRDVRAINARLALGIPTRTMKAPARTTPDNPPTSGDAADNPVVAEPATADDGLREQIAAALDAADYRQDMRRDGLADAILPVVNRRMEQLAAGRRLMGARIDTLTARAEAAEADLEQMRRGRDEWMDLGKRADRLLLRAMARRDRYRDAWKSARIRAAAIARVRRYIAGQMAAWPDDHPVVVPARDVLAMLDAPWASDETEASPAATDAEAKLAEVRATNQRLNLRCQQAESKLATYERAVGEWELSERGTYIPLRTLTAIAKAVGREFDAQRFIPHYQRVEEAEAAIARVRALAADIRADANQMTATEADNLRIIADHLTAALDAPAGEVTP